MLSVVAKSEGVQLWQQFLSENIRKGIYIKAIVKPQEKGNLFEVCGERPSGKHGPMVAKFGSQQRADDAAHVVNNLSLQDPKKN